MTPKFYRHWCMPNSDTFQMEPVKEILSRFVAKGMFSIDPFARNSEWCDHTNDLNPNTKAIYHMPADEYLAMMLTPYAGMADVVLFDPPYSPRQISECYKIAAVKCSTSETQNAALYSRCRQTISQLVKTDGIVISFGWNSIGMGKGFGKQEIHLLCHGGAHNDTIVVVDRKVASQSELF